jgi:hypothetical protein
VVPEGLATAWALFARAFQSDVAPQYESIHAGVRVENDIRVRLVATGKNAEAARELGVNARDSLKQLRRVFVALALANEEVEPISRFLLGARITEKGNTVTVTGTLEEEDANELFKRALGPRDEKKKGPKKE